MQIDALVGELTSGLIATRCRLLRHTEQSDATKRNTKLMTQQKKQKNTKHDENMKRPKRQGRRYSHPPQTNDQGMGLNTNVDVQSAKISKHAPGTKSPDLSRYIIDACGGIAETAEEPPGHCRWGRIAGWALPFAARHCLRLKHTGHCRSYVRGCASDKIAC